MLNIVAFQKYSCSFRHDVASERDNAVKICVFNLWIRWSYYWEVLS